MSRVERISMRDVKIAERWIRERIKDEAASQFDLQEALLASRQATPHPYSTHPKEWPPLIEVGENWKLPREVLERYDAADEVFFGSFPEIQCAWAVLDNSFLLWSFVKRNGPCHQYNVEEHHICATGLAKCRPGVFREEIKYLLVLATDVELVLVGLSRTKGPDGRDPNAEILVKPLPGYTILSDGVAMACVTSTNNGRIFMAGHDAHIYELLYTTGTGADQRCRKVCLTAGTTSMISRLVPPNVFQFGAVDPVVEMVVDNERQICYARTEEMKLQAYVFGPNGEGSLKKVAEERNLLNQRNASLGISQSARPGRSNKPSIISISPLYMPESKWLHLVAAMSDGRRMYLSTSSSGTGSSISFSEFNNHPQTPNCLKVVSTRPSPLLGVGFGAATIAGTTQNEDLLMNVETADYLFGTLVLSDVSPNSLVSLHVVSRDPTAHSQVGSSSGQSSRALREFVSTLPIEGSIVFVTDVLPSSDTAATVQSLYAELGYCGLEVSGEPYEKACAKLWARGDLSTQHILPRRKIVVLTTMCVMELVLNRPVDILRNFLESNPPRSLIEDFFTRFGLGEAAAMCMMLAARIIDFDDSVSNTVSDIAAGAFDDMSYVVQEGKHPFSAAHEGISLCTSRLLFPLWNLSVMSKETSSDGMIICRLSTGAMNVLESKIRSLERFLRSRRDQGEGHYGRFTKNLFGASSSRNESANKRQRFQYSIQRLPAMEVRSIECTRQLLLRFAEALDLLQFLSQHHVVFQGLEASFRQALVRLTFDQLVCSQDGEQIATRLVSAVMENYNGSDGEGRVDDISRRLRDGCPSYLK
ncbi:PREDICTED: nuclear pore complex protein NUP155-like [Camelina sativa]|uniref:Nuclear pore complex protein NUP155-like n=1 Tax=Camelina sativa TaxID=90675 RepID=A0ABM0U9D7_CAMSA|nr:PREDICTED: nuclear pore complex protein NUP155-like [Camelina sativa]